MGSGKYAQARHTLHPAMKLVGSIVATYLILLSATNAEVLRCDIKGVHCDKAALKAWKRDQAERKTYEKEKVAYRKRRINSLRDLHKEARKDKRQRIAETKEILKEQRENFHENKQKESYEKNQFALNFKEILEYRQEKAEAKEQLEQERENYATRKALEISNYKARKQAEEENYEKRDARQKVHWLARRMGLFESKATCTTDQTTYQVKSKDMSIVDLTDIEQAIEELGISTEQAENMLHTGSLFFGMDPAHTGDFYVLVTSVDRQGIVYHVTASAGESATNTDFSRFENLLWKMDNGVQNWSIGDVTELEVAHLSNHSGEDLVWWYCYNDQ